MLPEPVGALGGTGLLLHHCTGPGSLMPGGPPAPQAEDLGRVDLCLPWAPPPTAGRALAAMRLHGLSTMASTGDGHD